MEYKQIKKENYNINLIKTDRFKTISVVFTFVRPFKKEYIPLSSLLNTMLVKTSKKYKQSRNIVTELEKLYNMDVFSKLSILGNIFTLEYGIEFINPKFTDHEMYDKSFSMFKELIFNPNVDDNKFSSKEFQMYKNNQIMNIESVKDNSTMFAEVNYNKIMFKKLPYENTPFSLLKLFKEIDEKSLYKFYKDIIFDSKFIVTVVGDFEEELVLKNINKITKYLSNKNYELSELNLNEIETNKVNEVVEQKKLNQSTLLVGYKFYNLTDFERNYVLQIYNLILGTMNNSILFVNVREKKSLCYSISSYIHKYVPSITIEAGINSNNYDKTIKEIKSCVKLMKNKDEINKLFTNALNTINLTLNDYYEDVNKIVNHYVMKEINNIISIEEMRENYNKVTVEDIVNLNKKIELNTIYFLEGTNDKKN